MGQPIHYIQVKKLTTLFMHAKYAAKPYLLYIIYISDWRAEIKEADTTFRKNKKI